MAVSEKANLGLRTERLARVIDREVAPLWHDRLARLIFRHFVPRPDILALDVHCGSGRATAELLRRLPDSSRVLALGDDVAALSLARARVNADWKPRVYFKEGDFDDVADMPDRTYDLTFANAVLTEKVLDWEAGLAELVRITKPSGTILASIPLEGTWAEAEDLLDEVLRDAGETNASTTLERFRHRRPSVAELTRALERLGIARPDYVVEHEQFQLLFRSGREFLFAPIIEHGPLGLWKAIIGDPQLAKRLFWRLKDSIDTYYTGRVFSVSASAAVIAVELPSEDGRSSGAAARYWRRYPSLASLWSADDEPIVPPLDTVEFEISLREESGPFEEDHQLEEIADITSELQPPSTEAPSATAVSPTAVSPRNTPPPLPSTASSSHSNSHRHPPQHPATDGIPQETGESPIDASVEIDLEPDPDPRDDSTHTNQLIHTVRATRMVQALGGSETDAPQSLENRRGRWGRRPGGRG